MGPHKNLRVWNESMELAKMVYQITANFPKEELLAL